MLRSKWLQNILRDHWGKLLAAQVLIVFAAGYLVASPGQSDVPNWSTAAGEHAAHVVAGPALWTCSIQEWKIKLGIEDPRFAEHATPGAKSEIGSGKQLDSTMDDT